MSQFSGKTVLVTGTSSGMGRAAALRLASQGATVIAAARRADRGRELVGEAQATGGTIRYVRTDIAESASIDSLFATIEKDYGGLDGALNNAGIEDEPCSLPDVPVETFDRVFNTNVRGTWLCMRHEMRIMRAQGRGAIVNVSSIAGIMGMSSASVYTASKHAVVGMTKSASLELAGKGIRINCLCPGGMRTEMSGRWIEREPDGEAGLARLVPMKRMAAPEEMAEMAVFLLSGGASYVTGAVIVVDGGLTASSMPA